jgi:hypothetical protein
MGKIWGKLKNNIFLLFCMDLYHKDIVWVLFWGKLKKKFFAFQFYLYYKAVLSVIF